MDFKVVYTLCSEKMRGNWAKDLIQQTELSLRSIRRYVEREDIIVYYHPPRNDRDKERLTKYAVVEDVPIISVPFGKRAIWEPRYFGEKLHLCETDSPTVIFLDCDTVMLKDIRPLLEGDYDFAVRSANGPTPPKGESWLRMYEWAGKTPMPTPSTAFIIFKNYFHKKIYDDYRKCLTDPSWPNPRRGDFCFRDMDCMGVAMSDQGAKVKWLTYRDISWEWTQEFGLNPYIFHFDSIKTAKDMLDGRYFHCVLCKESFTTLRRIDHHMRTKHRAYLPVWENKLKVIGSCWG